MIGYFIRGGDPQVLEDFVPHQRLYRDIIEKYLGDKKYGESLKLLLIEFCLEGKHLPFPEKPFRVLNYSRKQLGIIVVVGVSKYFGAWSESKKRSFIVSTITKAVELVKERMDRKGIKDIEFQRLLADLDICSQEYLALPPIVIMDNMPTAWDLMKKGEFELAYARLTDEMVKNPDSLHRTIGLRSRCLLLLDRPEVALIDFQKLIELRPYSDYGYIDAGIALWCLDRQNEAVETWKRALSAIYTDAAGGVEVPAILTFAAIMMTDRALEKYSRSLLEKKWKTKRVAVWPGPIAGYLLGKIDDNTLIRYSMIENSTLKKRRLTKIHFWMGLAYYRQGKIQEYQNHLRQTLLGHIIEPEYYLAKYELKKMG